MEDQAFGDSARLPDGSWLVDWFSPFEFTAHARTRQIYHATSPFQTIEIVETRDFGRCLLLDHEVQSYEADEFIYHESLVHPALILHPDPRHVLVIGGGEGATLREVLRHHRVEQATMVDLDRQVVDAARIYLPTFHQGALDAPRAALYFGDGRAFLEEHAGRYDVILVDINNPLEDGPAQRLFTREFYETMKARLKPGGVAAVQAGAAHPLGLACPATIHTTLRKVFASVWPYLVYIPSFTASWTFCLAGETLPSPREVEAAALDERLGERMSGALRLYDGETHHHLFCLPRYVREGLAARTWSVSRDGRPVVTRFPGYAPDAEASP